MRRSRIDEGRNDPNIIGAQQMKWQAINGTGLTFHGVERTSEERVTFTIWFSILWVAIFPLSSYSALYNPVGQEKVAPASYEFTDIQKVPHNTQRLVRTLLTNWCVAVVAFTPMIISMKQMRQGAIPPIELVCIIASCAWPTLVLHISQKQRHKKLLGKS